MKMWNHMDAYNEGVCSNHRYDTQTTKGNGRYEKKPKKKRANPTVMRIYVLKTTKIQLGICLDWMDAIVIETQVGK